WVYMLLILMILGSMMALEKASYPQIRFWVIITLGLTVLFFVLLEALEAIGFLGKQYIFDLNRFIPFFILAIISLLAFLCICRFLRKKEKAFATILLITICLSVVVNMFMYINLTNNDKDNVVDDPNNIPNASTLKFVKLGENLKIEDPQYRYRTYDTRLNLTGQAAGLSVFNSTVSNSSHEFNQLFEFFNINSFHQRKDIYGLPELLAGKYSIETDAKDKSIVDSYTIDDQTFYVADNPACPIGFAEDSYITKSDLLKIPIEQRAMVLMQALVVDDCDENKVSSDLPKFDKSTAYSINLQDNISRTTANKLDNFNRDTNGFTATSNFKNESYIYLTVPNDKGWTAQIDGEDAEIINSCGMMAIKIPAGKHDISFSYQTPAFALGAIVSFVC
ncbi:MAG: YfhO family protein, partial [Enterococcus sp.]|nr:YfhO family protein [Enterococcus sp.]